MHQHQTLKKCTYLRLKYFELVSGAKSYNREIMKIKPNKVLRKDILKFKKIFNMLVCYAVILFENDERTLICY